jgi:hypothetical protein
MSIFNQPRNPDQYTVFLDGPLESVFKPDVVTFINAAVAIKHLFPTIEQWRVDVASSGGGTYNNRLISGVIKDQHICKKILITYDSLVFCCDFSVYSRGSTHFAQGC